MEPQWNLAGQTEIRPTTKFQVGYVGQHGSHLMVPVPYSQLTLNNGVVGAGLFFQGNPTLSNEISTVSGTASVGFMTYSGLQTLVTKRIANGLQGQIAYTWSHCLTNNSGYYGIGGQAAGATSASPYYQNLYNPAGDYASCYYNANNIVSIFATYDLPVGQGKQFGANMNPVV